MELVVANLDDLRAEITRGFERRAAAGPVSCGIAGGPTALIYLAALKAARVDWSQIRFFTVDERHDPAEGGERNAEMVHRILAPVRNGRGPWLFPMSTADPDIEACAAEYDRVLDRELQGDPLDLAIVGVGEDGQVAGLFTGHPALQELTRVAAVHQAPRPPRQRLTLSLPFLISTADIWVVAVGERKRAIVQAATARRETDSPFDLLLRHAPNVTLFTDQVIRGSDPPRRPR